MSKVYVREVYDEDGEPFDPPSWIVGSGHHPADQEVFFQSMEVNCEERAARNQKGKPRNALSDYQKSCVSKAQRGKVTAEETKQNKR